MGKSLKDKQNALRPFDNGFSHETLTLGLLSVLLLLIMC